MTQGNHYRLADLTTGSLFKIAFLSVAGFYLILAPLFLLAGSLDGFYGGAEMGETEKLMAPIMMGINIIIGPVMFGLYTILGRWVYSKFFPKAASPELMFEGDGYWFHTLTPKSLYRIVIPCIKGMFLGMVCLFAPFWAISLLIGLFTSQFAQLLPMFVLVGIFGIVYFIYPYIWGFFFMLGSYVMRPLTRKAGRGTIAFKPATQAVEEVFS